MEKRNSKKIAFIVITMLAFLLLISGGILTIIAVLIKENKLFYISVPMLIVAFVTYLVLFIILGLFFKKKE